MRRSTRLIPALVVLGAFLTGGLMSTAAAQDASPAEHPIVGAWMASTPGGPALAAFSDEGTVVVGLPASAAGPLGLVFVSSEVGAWEAIDDQAIHFTAVQLLTDADGAFVGTLTIEGYPVVSEDGQTSFDDMGSVTIRDATNAVVDTMEGGPPVTGVRMGVGAPGFSEASAQPAASPSNAP